MSLEGINWNDSAKAADFANDGPYRVYVWHRWKGRSGLCCLDSGTNAANGAKVNIYQEGGTGKVHYVLSFDDWAGMADFGDKESASEEFRFLQAVFADVATPIGSVQGEPLYYTDR